MTCDSCDFVTDSRTTLVKHQQRKHDKEAEEALELNHDRNPPLEMMFCIECNIQFSSWKTYSGHKEFYCSQRRNVGAPPTVIEPTVPIVPEGLAEYGGEQAAIAVSMGLLLPTDPAQLAQATAAKLATQTALALANPVLANGMPFTLPTLNMLKDLPQAMLNGKAVPPTQSRTPPKSPEERGDQPLDLSQKIKSESPSSNTSSPKARQIALSPRPNIKEPRLPVWNMDSRVAPENLPVPSVYSNTSPLIMPSASISKCVDCNIVFYKHENYLIHKAHYCSGRQADSPQSSGGNQERQTPESLSPEQGRQGL